MLSLDQGKILVELARNSIKTVFSKESIDLEKARTFSEDRGVFVTLHKEGALRGCIGFPEPIYPLYRAVVQAARAAAFQDPRFPSLFEQELSEIQIEVSVLTPPKLLKVNHWDDYLKRIRIGHDGLMISKGMNKGLLLPVVALEFGWNAKEFLEHTCEKAGLEKDAWKDLESRIFIFQSQVFSESGPDLDIIERM